MAGDNLVHGGGLRRQLCLNRQFNLYYLHWWTLTHFLFESPRCRPLALDILRRGGSLEAFEQTLGPVDQVQVEWHTYVRHLKDVLSGEDLKFRKAQRLSWSTNSVPPGQGAGPSDFSSLPPAKTTGLVCKTALAPRTTRDSAGAGHAGAQKRIQWPRQRTRQDLWRHTRL